MTKPALADNWLEAKQRLPAWQEPKYDGVRGGFWLPDTFTGRSLKPFKNKALTIFWSQPCFKYLDGELIMPDSDGKSGRMCSLTTGLCGTVKETAVPDLIAFDYIHPDLIAKGAVYRDRYNELEAVVEKLQQEFGTMRVRLMPYYTVSSIEEVLLLDAQFLDDDLEGSILRNPDAAHKEGRPSKDVQELMRIKRFIDFEFTIDELVEAQENQNEAKINELGHTERSSHKENKVPKGMVGKLKGRMLKDVIYNGEILFKEGSPVTAGAGTMTHPERIDYWLHPEKIVGQIGKAKTFPKGVLSKPRIPIFLSLRAAEDM